jgi:hypothetical protein
MHRRDAHSGPNGPFKGTGCAMIDKVNSTHPASHGETIIGVREDKDAIS